METNGSHLEATVRVLRAERDGLEREVRSIREQLDLYSRRLATMEQALQALEALRHPLGQGPPAEEGPESAVEDDDVSHERQHGSHRPGTGGRINSSEAVAQLVKDADGPLTRQEIKARFEQQGLIPDSWRHPANALNNAISRAEKRGLIQKRGNLFAVDFPRETPSGSFELESEV